MIDRNYVASAVRPTTTTSRLTSSRCVCWGAEAEARGEGDQAEAAEEGPADETAHDEAVAGEEAVPPKLLPTPVAPSKSERDAHRVTHCPYRSWCDDCREGCGLEMAHRRCDQESRRLPIIGFDYMFVGKRRVYLKGEGFADGDTLESMLTVLVVRCHKSRALFAHPVPKKGVDDKGFIVESMVKDIMWLGYPRVLLKCDCEPSTLALLRDALAALKVEGLDASPELPPPYDPQANGSTEIGVKLVKGKLAIFRRCIERRIGFRIPELHLLMSWMASHVAAVLNYCIVGPDGLTAYHRLRGREYSGRLVGFGKKVAFRRPGRGEIRGCSIARGTFLGMQLGGSQYTIYDTDQKKIISVRTVSRLPDDEKWDADALEAVDVSPYDTFTAKPAEAVFKDPAPKEIPVPSDIVMGRGVYLKDEDFEAYGTPFLDANGACTTTTTAREGQPNRTRSDAGTGL